MKTTAIAIAITASLGFGSLALAQGNDHRGQNNDWQRNQQNAPRQDNQRAMQRQENRVEQRVEQRVDRRMDQRAEQRAERRMDQRADRRMDRWQEQRVEQRLDQRAERWNNRRAYYNARGPEFRRGGYIPREYRNPTYVINDYRPYHLSPPPRNHQWVQVGADYVLIAIATGIIANIVLNQ